MKTHKTAGGGMCAALCMVMLFAASFIPNIKIAFMFASSLVMGICILRYKTAVAAVVYAAVSLLSLFIIPNKLISLIFVSVFGIYPIIKLYIEKLSNITVEYVIKFIVWNIQLVVLYVIFCALGQDSFRDFGMLLVWIAGLFILCLYDFAFGIVINAFYKTYSKYL